MTSNTAWPSGQATTTEPQFANMDAIGEQDFANLLDFESFDFLANFDGNPDGAHKLPAGVDLNLLATTAASQAAQHEGHRTPAVVPSTGQSMFDMHMQMNFAQAQAGQQFSMPPGARHILQTHPVVPPTPNSVEMHSDMRAYVQQLDAQTRAIIEHEYKMRQQDAMNFTPLGTPAVTPHDSQFNAVNQFAVPGEYFSPLVSPALEGQQQRGQRAPASTASTASPVDFDVDMLGDPASQQPKQSRRTRRQSTSTRNGTAGRKVAQSPIQKPSQKRKSALSSVIPPKEVTEILEMHAQTRLSPTSPSSARMSRAYASSSESISPEPLSEGLMGPPPKPGSAVNSPAILANGRSPTVGPNGVGAMPATPASLMRINPKDSPGGVSVPSTIHEQYGDDIPMLDDLILPEAATASARANLPKIDTAAANGDATPRMSARKGPRSAPLQASTPTTAKPMPLVSSAASPVSTVASPAVSRRPELKGRTTSKKRGSLGDSRLVSPALRPKISPSIKPLLPEGEKLTEEQHALLLTSRSNYQNLIEGRNIPGVTYPSDLPSQLTSKRTSHKIAEQGRRQRINVALQEMQCLLPKMSPTLGATKIEEDDDEDDDEPGGSGKKKGGKGGGNSKAATVENAIVYIKAMQDKEKSWQEERDARDREMDELRKKLDALERRLSASKSPSATEGDSLASATAPSSAPAPTTEVPLAGAKQETE